MLIAHNKWCEAFQLHPKENQEHETGMFKRKILKCTKLISKTYPG